MSRSPLPSHQGTFWLAGSAHQVPGRFAARPDARLELDGNLHGFVWPPDDENDHIHGLVDDTPLTLFDCFDAGSHASRFGAGQDRPTHEPRYIIGGAHLPPDAEFDRVRIWYASTEAWSLGVDAGESIDLTGGGRLTVVDDGGVRWLEVVGVALRSYLDLDKAFATPLQSLLTIASGGPSARLETQVANSETDTWLPVLSSGEEAPWQPVKPQRVLLRLRSLGLAGVARWLDGAARFNPIPPMVAAAVANEDVQLERETLMLATVAEGLHAELYPDSQKMTKDEAAQIRAVAVDAVASVDPDAQHYVRSLLGNLVAPSFKTRLLELAKAAEDVAPGITGRSSHWAKAVDDVRNRYAHLSDLGFLMTERINLLIGVNLSLKWVLVALLLQEAAAADADTLRQAFRQSSDFAQYRANAALYLPAVFET